MSAAVELATNGLSYTEAAAITGIPRHAISDRLRAGGVASPPVPSKRGRPRIPADVVRPALAAVARGVRVEDAAADAGIAVSTLRRRIRDHGVFVLRQRSPRKNALTLADREEVRAGIVAGESDVDIAERLDRHRGTIGREIEANGGRERYRAHLAHQRADELARRPKSPWTETRPALWEEVQRLLRTKKWSPEQIAERLRRDHPD